jgi:hypothetical protein
MDAVGGRFVNDDVEGGCPGVKEIFSQVLSAKSVSGRTYAAELGRPQPLKYVIRRTPALTAPIV